MSDLPSCVVCGNPSTYSVFFPLCDQCIRTLRSVVRGHQRAAGQPGLAERLAAIARGDPQAREVGRELLEAIAIETQNRQLREQSDTAAATEKPGKLDPENS